MKSMSNVGAALRIARRARGLSLNQVATQAGVSTATLSRIETENQTVDVSRLLEISKILDVSPAQIIGGEGHAGDAEDALVDALAALPAPARARVISAAAAPRHQKRNQIEAQIETLLATVDLIRNELASLARQVRRRRR